jgi:hypothetical protein
VKYFFFALLVLSFPFASVAQDYQMDWSVEQPYGEVGHIRFDVTNDGTPDLVKRFGNQFECYDLSTEGLNPVWALADTNFYYLYPSFVEPINNGASDDILVNATYGPDNDGIAYFSFGLYQTGSFNLISKSEYFSSNLASVVIADPDNDNKKEIVIGSYWYDTGAEVPGWYSQIIFLSGEDLSLEWYSYIYSGIIAGLVVGDVDDDNLPELLFTLYDPDAETSFYNCVSYIGATSAAAPAPPTILGNNFPNPFNPTTTIPVSLSKSEIGSLIICDTMGRKVKTITSGNLPAGNSVWTWDGTNERGAQVASGTYLAKLKTATSTDVKRMMLVK